MSPPLLSFGGAFVGGHLSGTATFSNVGGSPLTIQAVHPPSAPFSVSGLPRVGQTIATGGSLTVHLTFNPTRVGSFTSAITLDSDGGNGRVGLSASAGIQHPSVPKAPRIVPGVVNARESGRIQIVYSATVRATSRFTLERLSVGRQRGHRCIGATKQNRGGRRCLMFETVITFSHRDRVGANRLGLASELRAAKLSRGKYRLRAILVDTAGTSHRFSVEFRVT